MHQRNTSPLVNSRFILVCGYAKYEVDPRFIYAAFSIYKDVCEFPNISNNNRICKNDLNELKRHSISKKFYHENFLETKIKKFQQH